jgi:Rod binding domain-containing protein
VKEGAAECRLAADERTALLDEIDRLRKGERRDSSRNLLPDRRELEQAWQNMEDFMRRMMRSMRDDKDTR